MDYKDYYQVLGVQKGADQKEIRRVYRKLARQYHPDVNPGDKAAEARFKEINEAYEVLSDPEKRRKYDELQENYQRWQQTGGRPGGFDWSQWAAGDQAARQGGFGPGGVRVEYGDVEDMFGEGGFSDFFQTIFGGVGPGGMGGAAGRQRGPARGRDLEHELDVTLDEAYRGTQRLLEMDGRRLEVKIPAGVRTGSRVRVAGEGVPGARGGARGDLYLRINVLPHPTFERKEDDLYEEVPVDMFVALLGGEVRVPTLGGTVSLRIPPGTQSGRTFRLAGQGMPRLRNPQEHGSLYAKVRVRLPENLSPREMELAQEWARLRGSQP